MKKILLTAATLAALPMAARAQDAILPGGLISPATPPKPAPAPARPVAEGTVVIAPSPVTPAADPRALKVRADMNPATNRLVVRTDAPGPTRIEINDATGRPVLTHNTMVGTTPTALEVSKLPAGTYVVRCTAGERSGMRQVTLGM